MTDVSLVFKERFTAAFEKSNFRSFRQLSLKSECSEPLVQQIINGKFDGSRAGPGVFTLFRLASTLGLSLDSLLQSKFYDNSEELAALNDVKGRDPASFDTLMSVHWRSGGRLDGFDHVKEHFDLYRAPTEETITPQIQQIGPKGLLSLRLETTDIRVAQREFDRLSDENKKATTAFHREVMASGIRCDNTFLDHRLHLKPVHVRAGYSRLGLRVEGKDGAPMVLIACKPIPV